MAVINDTARVSRAVAFAAACTAVSSAGHAAAGGCPVGAPGLAAGFCVALALGLVLGGRERSWLAVTGWLWVGQAGLHVVFRFGGMPRQLPAMACSGPLGGLPMIMVHLAAGALVGWWLRQGEAVLWRLLRLAESVAACALGQLTGAHAAPAVPVASELVRWAPVEDRGAGHIVLLADCAPRRGPPTV